MRDLDGLACARGRVVEVPETYRWQVTRSASRFVASLVHLALAAGLAAGTLFPPAVLAAWPPDERVLILSAYPTEGAKLLAAAAPVTEVGTFNGRRFFAGTIAGKNVVMGLTGIGLVNADRTDRAVPCITPGDDLLGCAACGAPPGTVGISSDPTPFLDPNFFLELFQSFAPGAGGSAVIQDMETAAVARIAIEKTIPFIAFRGVSDGRGDPLTLPPIPYLQFVVYQQLAADNAAAATLAFLAAW